jgi:parvulin-like peptidyl-prolyl isomerase
LQEQFMTWLTKLCIPLCALLCALAAAPALAAPESPVVSKDSSTFVLEDLNLYFLRNLGKEGLLDFLQNMVVYQEGLKQGLKPTEAEKTKFIDETMTRDVYNQFKQLYSAKAVEQLVEYTLVNSKYEKWLRNKIKTEKNFTVTEKEARDYFTSHISEFHVPEGVYLSIISVDNKPQVDAVLDRLNKGEDFSKIAGEVNMDPKMRAARGEIGVYRKGDNPPLPRELETAAFGLKKGQYTKTPIKGTNYHLLFCHERYAEITPTFDDVKELLMKDMLEAKIDPHYADALNALMAKELPRFSIMADLFKPEPEATASAKPAAKTAKPQ